MARFVFTGQPPDHPTRLAVGPIPQQMADRVEADLLERGWREVWRVAMDVQTTTEVLGELTGG